MPHPNPSDVTHANIDRALRAGADLRIIVTQNAARIADVFDEQIAEKRAARDLREVWPGATLDRYWHSDSDGIGRWVWRALSPHRSEVLARADSPEKIPALVREAIRVRPGYAISPVVARFPEVEAL